MPKTPEPGSRFAPMVIGVRDQTGTRLYRKTVTADLTGRKPKIDVGDPPTAVDAVAWDQLPSAVADAMDAAIEAIAGLRIEQQQRADVVGALYEPRPERVVAMLWRGDASALQQLLDLLDQPIDTNQRRRGKVQATPTVELQWARTPGGTCQITIHELAGKKRAYSPGPGWWLVVDADGELQAMQSDDFKARYQKAAG